MGELNHFLMGGDQLMVQINIKMAENLILNHVERGPGMLSREENIKPNISEWRNALGHSER